jgi:uncharacterized DUF497 family protein
MLGRTVGVAASVYCSYTKSVDISFDPAKRAKTLQERGLDFADAGELFAGLHATEPDNRRDYGEPRFRSAGVLNGRIVVVVWTSRGGARRIISMRYAHEREAERWRQYMGGS